MTSSKTIILEVTILSHQKQHPKIERHFSNHLLITILFHVIMWSWIRNLAKGFKFMC